MLLTYQYGAGSSEPSATLATIDGVADYQNAYQYNSQGQLTEIIQTSQAGGNAVAEKEVDFTYNSAGQIASIDRYQGGQLTVEADYTYDSSGRLTSLVYQQGTTVLASYTYTYAASSDASSDVTPTMPAPWLPTGPMLPQSNPSEIDLSQLDQAPSPGDLIAGMTSSDGAVNYTYDASGELVGATTGYPTSQANESYSYDANGNPANSGDVIGPNNELLSDGTYTYTYDADGNRTAKFIDANHDGVLGPGDTDITEYTWDVGGRLTAVTSYANDAAVTAHMPTQTVDYMYDVENRWVGETVWLLGQAPQQTRFAYDGGQIVLEFQGTGSLLPRSGRGRPADRQQSQRPLSLGPSGRSTAGPRVLCARCGRGSGCGLQFRRSLARFPGP